MNPCDLYHDRLAAFAPEGEEDRDLARHLEACPACRAEFQSYLALTEELQELSLPDPGDLYFQIQAKAIARQIAEEDRAGRSQRRWWAPSLALAAAVVLLFIGFSRFRETPRISEPEWREALQFLSEEEGVLDPEPGLGLEDLSPEQLERLATNIEQRLQQGDEGDLPEESGDWDELSGPELERLLQRLNETSPRRQHEA